MTSTVRIILDSAFADDESPDVQTESRTPGTKYNSALSQKEAGKHSAGIHESVSKIAKLQALSTKNTPKAFILPKHLQPSSKSVISQN